MTEPLPTARTYRSPRRTQQAKETRKAVLDVARSLFADRGWAATSIRDVAGAAGVSVETVYGSVGSKATLFAAVYDSAVTGDDEDVPLAERPVFAAMGEGATIEERATAAADLLTGIHQRASSLGRALREGAASDVALAARLRQDEDNRRTDDERGLRLVLRRSVTRSELDVFWAMTSPEVYDLLTARSGWTDAAYRDWLVAIIIDLNHEESS